MNDNLSLIESPSSQQKVSARTASNFFVTPLGRGKVAQKVHEHEEDDPAASMGLSIMGSVVGGALGLGPMFEIAFEAIKTGMEISDGKNQLNNTEEINNLNPAAAIRPDLAFNFRSIGEQKKQAEQKANVDDEKRNQAKRTWSSGEAQFLLGRLAEKRLDSLGANPVMAKQASGVVSAMQKKPLGSSSSIGKSK
jgi:hypothetical protein